MSLPELLASAPSVSANPWVLAHLTQAITTTPSAGTVEQYTVDAAAPTALRGANGRFTVAIDGEEMHVFASSTGTSPWYFVRGINGTVTTHLNGASIYHIPTARSLKSFRRPSELRSRLSPDVQSNFWNPGPADNPVVTLSAANAASVITGQAAVPATPAGYTYSPNDPRLRITGAPGPLQQASATWPGTVEWGARYGVTKTLASTGFGMSYHVNFDVYCTRLEIAVLGGGVAPNVFVNGVKQTVPALANDGNQHNILLDWTGGVAGANLGERRIRVEFSAGQKIMGFYMAPAEEIIAPTRDLGGLRMITTGDSWTDGTGTSDGVSGFPYLTGLMLGIADTWLAGIGGTGYLQDSSQGNHLASRLSTDIYPNNPDILLLCFGSDDSAYTATQIATEASADWEAIMGNMPDCLLVVMGPYAGPAAQRALTIATNANNALKTAAAGLGVPFLDSLGENWIPGTGYVGATNSSGPSDTLIGSDGVHPTTEGHKVMARWTASEMMNIIRNL